jgi:hypothetical protein
LFQPIFRPALQYIRVSAPDPIRHNHLCGCSKCRKLAGVQFARPAVVSSDGLEIAANGDKLKVVDDCQSIRRHACKDCGAHLYGDVPNPDRHFQACVSYIRNWARKMQAVRLSSPASSAHWRRRERTPL